MYRNTVTTYSDLFEGLSSLHKIERIAGFTNLLEHLAQRNQQKK